MAILCAMSMAGEFNLCDANHVIQLFEQATEANYQSPGRVGSTVELPKQGRLTLTGDVHDHKENFRKILKVADLDASPDHHVLLHELVHGDHLINNMDLSYRILAQAAELKIRKPNQVHFLLANHELAQVNGEGILKNGMSQVQAFSDGLHYLFGERALPIEEAIGNFIKSMPLAVRCANGVMCCHSLPGARHLPRFDVNVLSRDLVPADFINPTGSAHMMVWGRRQPQELADVLADAWGVDLFVMGHQKAEMGYEEYGETMLVLNCNHNHGAVIPMNLAKRYTLEKLMNEVVLLAGVL